MTRSALLFCYRLGFISGMGAGVPGLDWGLGFRHDSWGSGMGAGALYIESIHTGMGAGPLYIYTGMGAGQHTPSLSAIGFRVPSHVPGLGMRCSVEGFSVQWKDWVGHVTYLVRPYYSKGEPRFRLPPLSVIAPNRTSICCLEGTTSPSPMKLTSFEGTD